MNKTIIILALCICAGFVSASPFESFSSLWQSWKLRHNKVYSASEEAARFAIFIENVKKIAQNNAENNGVKFAVNKFADLTASEFSNQQAGCGFATNEEKFQKKSVSFPNVTLPDSIDWREKNAVTAVKDQGQCGSCYAFSAVGAIEGFYSIHNGKLLSFSTQQIVDCDKEENEGCRGGWIYVALDYAAEKGLELETDYPYAGREGVCRYNASKAIKANDGYDIVTPYSTFTLKNALANHGPVSVVVQADENVFQFYRAGVITTGCGSSVNHAVLAVGYTTINSLEAFIVKNSWGTSWGDKGYVMISTLQQFNQGKGACGILSRPIRVN